nr:retrotransposon protein, putative, Ty1-copia subclass [Tanacetum cinerariifolium]
MVWVLVDLPLGCKTVRSKWIFKKKTNMDGIVQTYKARLIPKGYTQLYGVDYEETFSPVTNIRAIRILISIAAFYDYEIWQMDVKTALLNGYLDEDIYMVQPEGFVDPNHLRKYASFKDLFMVLCKFQEGVIRDLIKKSKERLDLNKTQGASTPKEVKRLQNVPYALAVGCIINPEAELRVDCSCNAGFENDIDDMKSLTRYVLF